MITDQHSVPPISPPNKALNKELNNSLLGVVARGHNGIPHGDAFIIGQILGIGQNSHRVETQPTNQEEGHAFVIQMWHIISNFS